MALRPTTLERAYELARSGQFGSVGDLKRRLKEEGYADVDGQLYGPGLQRDLRRLCRDSTAGLLPGASAAPEAGGS